MNLEQEISCHILVSGRVQGVWFRAYAQEMATSLGLVGWVRNLKDGRVEAYCEGERGAVEKFINWCRKGPPAAKVEGVQIEYGQPSGQFKTFEIRY